MTVEFTIRNICCYIKTINTTGDIYTDQTYRFPYLSTANNYIMILYDHDRYVIIYKTSK